MFEKFHRYNCPACGIPIIGNSVQQLCNNLNDHNEDKHPSESARWGETNLPLSINYEPPDEWTTGLADPDLSFGQKNPTGSPRPEYMIPHGMTQNSQASSLPVLTAEDLKFLKSARVKW